MAWKELRTFKLFYLRSILPLSTPASWQLEFGIFQTLDELWNVTHICWTNKIFIIHVKIAKTFFCMTFWILSKMERNKRFWSDDTFSLRKATSVHMEAVLEQSSFFLLEVRYKIWPSNWNQEFSLIFSF